MPPIYIRPSGLLFESNSTETQDEIRAWSARRVPFLWIIYWMSSSRPRPGGSYFVELWCHPMNIKFIGQKNGKTHVNDKQHRGEEKAKHKVLTSRALVWFRGWCTFVLRVFYNHIHKDAVLKLRERTSGWVGSDSGMQVCFLFCCWIVLDQDIWVVCDAQRAMPPFLRSPFFYL